jgi:hypothetical protein
LPKKFTAEQVTTLVFSDVNGEVRAVDLDGAPYLVTFQNWSGMDEVESVLAVFLGVSSNDLNVTLLLQKQLERYLLQHVHEVHGFAVVALDEDGSPIWLKFPSSAFISQS